MKKGDFMLYRGDFEVELLEDLREGTTAVQFKDTLYAFYAKSEFLEPLE